MTRILTCRSFIKCVVIAVLLYGGNRVAGQMKPVRNDSFWNTLDGKPINSQGGGIFKFEDPKTKSKKYYWYGVHYAEADAYRNDPTLTQTKATFESVTCYSSTDLVNWIFEGDVLTKDKVNQDGQTWVGRLGVAYIAELKKYAMFVQHGTEVLVTVANAPTSQFTWHDKINMKQMIGTSNTGDQTVFTDEDTGKSYLVYSYGRGRNKIYVSEIGSKDGKVSLLDCTKVFEGESREGNCMFKYNGRYYMCASNIYGWDASLAYYLVAENIRGPYLPVNKMLVLEGAKEDYAHISQTGFFYVLKGTKQETVVYCGDRWADFSGNGLGYNQWCPLSFKGATPYFNSLSSWNLDAITGKWKLADDNNYVKNGSFEADRKRIPSIVKPEQTELTGWTTEVEAGNKISLDSLSSSMLNHFNTRLDRKSVIGEKSLKITDKVRFTRKVFQIIKSSDFVKIGKGSYSLAAKIKNSAGFFKLEMYAISKGKKISYQVTRENPTWISISIDHIPVASGKVEIGFTAEAEANSYCVIDDVALIKKSRQ